MNSLAQLRPQIATVTVSDLRSAAKACVAATEADREAKQAGALKKVAIMAVLEPLAGIKTEEELKALAPEELAGRIRRRVKAGAVRLKGIQLEEVVAAIKETQHRRDVSWKEMFVSRLGESAATEVMQATEETHFYRIEAPA